MPSDSRGTTAVTGRLLVCGLAARGPRLQGRLSGLVTSLSLLSEQEPQGAQLLSAACWRSCLRTELCERRPLLPKEASRGSRPGDTFTSLQSTLLVPKLCLGPARVHRWCLYSCSSFFIPWASKQCYVQIMRKREKEKEREGRRQGRGEREQKRGRKGGREEETERKKILDWPERVQGCPKEASV